jgi:uroporphyrinogen decarboxylase
MQSKRKPSTNKLHTFIENAAAEKRRAIAPLMGFPGVRMIGSTIKIAQQNCREHFKAIKKLNDTFAPDVVFPLMDLSVEANALGFFTVFPVHETPTVPQSPFAMEQLRRLMDIDIAFDARIMGYIETIRLMSMQLPDPLKASFVTGPFTLSALMMGAVSAATAVLDDPENLRTLCDFSARVIRQYARHLVAAGAQCICILEPSAVFLSPALFRDFSVAFINNLIKECEDYGVATIYHICGNTRHLINEMAQSGVTGISLDSPEAGIRLEEVMPLVPPETIVIGNISPTHVMLYGTSDDVRREVQKVLEATKRYKNFVLSTGCDLPFETSDENIGAFMQTAREYRLEAGR